MIMSADTARRFFGSGDVIGRTLTVPQAVWVDVRKVSVEMTLVGVIGNVKYSGLAVPPDDAIYRPFAQQPWIAPFLIARTTTDPATVLPSIRREIGAAGPGIVVSSVRTLDSIMADASAQPRAQTVVLAALTTLALAMSAVGLYGVVAFSLAATNQGNWCPDRAWRQQASRVADGSDEKAPRSAYLGLLHRHSGGSRGRSVVEVLAVWNLACRSGVFCGCGCALVRRRHGGQLPSGQTRGSTSIR